MRLGEYLEVGKKMKQTRMNARINQREMATWLELTNSSYSNYENGYSEPPVETVQKFCEILNISMNNLLGVKLSIPRTAPVRTFADFLTILIDLDCRGLLHLLCSYPCHRPNRLVSDLKSTSSLPSG